MCWPPFIPLASLRGRKAVYTYSKAVSKAPHKIHPHHKRLVNLAIVLGIKVEIGDVMMAHMIPVLAQKSSSELGNTGWMEFFWE